MVTTMAKAKDGIQRMGNVSKKAAPIKVKQEMIDFIKTQGMTRALKRAGAISAKGTKGEAEFLEGVRRMYGANRLSAATKAATPAKLTAPAGANKKPAGRMAKSAAPAPKKSSGMSTGAKITAGVAATAALVASRGKATGLAAKLSPGLAKSGVGKALGMGAKANPNSAANVMKKTIADKSGSVTVGPKGSFGKSTAATAKAGKVGTKSEYAQKAMQDKARAYLASRAAAKAAPAPAKTVKPRSTNTPAKPMPKTAKGRANYGKFGTRDEYLFEKNSATTKPAVKKAAAKTKKN
jgi:hypothetical protein